MLQCLFTSLELSHWLFRYAQELATCRREWEKLLDAYEIKTNFDEKCRHHINDPQKCGQLCEQILNNLVLYSCVRLYV